MKRRKFLQASTALSMPFFVGGTPFTAVGRNKLLDVIGEENDKVLVLVQLQGGNDGLSTFIPLDQYDNLAAVRSNILVPQSSTLNLTDDLAVHPNMENMRSLWDDSKLNIIQGVAYPNQNRSHFRSTDIWNTASEPDEFLTTGWMGRYFELNHADFPEGYPNVDNPDPLALSIGTVISETCQGIVSNYSLALTDPFAPGTVNIGQAGETQDNCYGRELDFVRDIARQTNAYSDSIIDAANQGNNLSTKYTSDNLSEKLKIVARLISGGIKTKIFVVQLGGFDTHSGQTEADNPSAGVHANLMRQLSEGLCAFQDDLVKLGIDDRVMGMTYSEFGRRIRSNESNGTDHGTAASIIVFGSCVNPGILGDNPVIDPQVEINEGVPMQYDFRSVYATMLMDWFGIDEQEVKDVLFEDFQHLPLIQCSVVSTEEELLAENLNVEAFPNPFSDYFTVKFESAAAEWYRISVFNAIGSEVKVITNQRFGQGNHELKIPSYDLSSGIYFVRVAGKKAQKTIRIVKA